MGHRDDLYRPGWLRIVGGCVHSETGKLVPWMCGEIELIWCGFGDVDEEEAPASRATEETVQETSPSTSSAFVPATNKSLIAHRHRDQSS